MFFTLYTVRIKSILAAILISHEKETLLIQVCISFN